MHKPCLIVFTCSRPDDLKRCLDSVLKQSYKEFELMVVNNGDDPATRQVLKGYDLKVIEERAKHLSRLFNLGWQNTGSELVAYLADDVELSQEWLSEGLASLERNPRAALATGPLVSPFEFSGEMHALYAKAQKGRFLSGLLKFYNYFVMDNRALEPCVLCQSGAYTIGQGLEPDFSDERQVDLATTSAMLFRRSAVASVGGFDQNFIFNHADGDLFVRLKRHGYSIIYNPKMKGVHYNRPGPSRSPFYIGRDTAYFYLKDIRPKSLKGFLAAAMNVLVLNSYWFYKAIKCGDIRQLSGISGFVSGLLDYLILNNPCFKIEGNK